MNNNFLEKLALLDRLIEIISLDEVDSVLKEKCTQKIKDMIKDMNP